MTLITLPVSVLSFSGLRSGRVVYFYLLASMLRACNHSVIAAYAGVAAVGVEKLFPINVMDVIVCAAIVGITGSDPGKRTE